NASRFIHASISTSPVSASWAIAGTSPPALSKSSMSWVLGHSPHVLFVRVGRRGGAHGGERGLHLRPHQDRQRPDAERLAGDAAPGGDRDERDDRPGHAERVAG